ncbi:MAG: reverse transcriptase domain-containing protein [Cetobacterium sp.]|uniref:reverse transcriptase domain-containing protein n=1 Tax=Cetobacterium sp. TaxID=2071632 RepID=UPI003F3E7B4E
MKRVGNLYNKIYDFNNLHNSYLLARRSKRYRSEVLKYTDNLEENLIIMQNELVWKTYKQGEYRTFKVYVPKERTIKALPFKDRVLQHAVNAIIEPIFTKGFYEHSYACLEGKGAHKASRVLKTWLFDTKQKDIYYLKCDVAKYFDSINHAVLINILESKIKCPDTLDLLRKIIDNGTGVGIPIGNLTSQTFANIYLNELDKFVKHKLKIKYYIRYMDDFIILDESKEKIHEYLHEIESYLSSNLALKLNHKTRIAPVFKGVDFVGYNHFINRTNLRRSTWVRQKKQIKSMFRKMEQGKMAKEEVAKTLYSILGHISHADTFLLKKNIENKFATLK